MTPTGWVGRLAAGVVIVAALHLAALAGGRASPAARTRCRAPHIAICPGLVIRMTVHRFNVPGAAIREKLDPRLRGAR